MDHDSYRDELPEFESTVVFKVLSDGKIYTDDPMTVQLRSELYYYSSDCYESPINLSGTIEECQPLAWEVQRLYQESRESILAELVKEQGLDLLSQQHTAALRANLEKMPEEPEDGVNAWLSSIDEVYFHSTVVPAISDWFKSEPDWSGYEEDYIPNAASSPAGAYEYFNDFGSDMLERLGVILIEGGVLPNLNYRGAELTTSVVDANKAAEDSGLAVRFVKI
jgi:hypothetical protein